MWWCLSSMKVSNIRKTFLIASFGIATPFAFGWLLAPFLFREVMEPSLQPGAKTVAMSSFAVFVRTHTHNPLLGLLCLAAADPNGSRLSVVMMSVGRSGGWVVS